MTDALTPIRAIVRIQDHEPRFQCALVDWRIAAAGDTRDEMADQLRYLLHAELAISRKYGESFRKRLWRTEPVDRDGDPEETIYIQVSDDLLSELLPPHHPDRLHCGIG